jgi:hypothetical protein
MLLGFVVSLAPIALGQAEKEGFIIDKFLSMRVMFVDNNGDGKAEILMNIDTEETAYTFSDPIDMPSRGDTVEISGDLNYYGAIIPIPTALVVVN